MEKIFTSYLVSPFGELIIGDYNNQICLCDWRYRKMRKDIDSRITKGLNSNYVEKETKLITETKNQLNEYFNHKRTTFDIALQLVGSEFQQQVWKELMKIPFGKTESYMVLARKLNNEKAIRAIASANGANAIAIIVPCHRIIGSDGKLVGYAGGLDTKRKLLQLEGYQTNSSQLKLF